MRYSKVLLRGIFINAKQPRAIFTGTYGAGIAKVYGLKEVDAVRISTKTEKSFK